ncbi:MAG: methyltransferase, partial [Alphaproteobacteria bacterium]|nr:methyltransferase [Alphaproteobacteria bacterium]
MSKLATTHDSLYQGRCTLEQPAKAYRFGTDAMLLAASIHAKPREKVLELGCGVGAVLLAGHVRLPKTRFVGIEREAKYAELAQKNVERNKAGELVSIIKGDIADKALFKNLGSFDHVIANPPYYETGRHSGALGLLRRVARQHEPDDLEMWLQSANRFLKPKGSVIFIHSAEKLDELMVGLKKFCGAIRVFPFWPQEGQSCKRIIIHALKGSKTPLSIMPGIVMHQHNGAYTKRADEIVN